ncbi:MAG: UbiA family prenyltransferase [Theionarchaea archaeon]|nr:UbiA family prenyltransferase [Theionarchaea archaeon]
MNLHTVRTKFLHTKLWGALEFIRIFNMTMPFTSGFIGVVMAGEGVVLNRAGIAGMLIPLFLWAGGQVFNDIFDLKVDTINTPYRAIPSRRFTIPEAVTLGGGLTLVGITLSIITRSYLCQLLTICAVVFSNIYSLSLKRKGVFGHINFAFCVLLCIYIGQSAVTGTVCAPYVPIGIFFYHIAINIMASVGDIPGDRETHVITLPVQIGGQQATVLATLLWMAGIAWSSYWSEHTILWMILILVISVLSFYNSLLLLADPSPPHATTTLRLFRCGTILLQLSLVIQWLSAHQVFMVIMGLGTFTVVTFILFEIPKGIKDPFHQVISHG